jgi:hypothetical protein
MPKASEWWHASGRWLQDLTEDERWQIQVFSYDYAFETSSGESILQQLLAEGPKLLRCLDHELRRSVRNRFNHVRCSPIDRCKSKPCPVFFVCHSLGGLVLKKVWLKGSLVLSFVPRLTIPGAL